MRTWFVSLICLSVLPGAAYAFFGMNTGAFMQSSMPATSYEFNAVNTVPPNTNGLAIAKDSSGNVILAGVTLGAIDGNTAVGVQHLYVTKYDSTGVRLWTRQMGVALKYVYARGVATDSSGNIFVGGSTTGDSMEIHSPVAQICL